jgi:hypothetical protein
MSDTSAEGYNPFEFVSDRISPITASGLAWLDEQLHEENKTQYLTKHPRLAVSAA